MASPSAATAPPSPVASRARLDSIDLVRGAVMVIMLLDHVRDFTHSGALLYDPLDNMRTTPLLYLTRWITHLCAPTFVFLAGLGAGIRRLRGAPPPELARFLWTRGLWLVFLEMTVLRVIIWANLDLSLLWHLQVIWAIGASMVLLSLMVRLPAHLVGLIGVVIVLGHNLLDGVRVAPWQGPASPLPTLTGELWMLLHQGGFFPIHGFPSPIVWAHYPLLPWTGVMLAGYGAATILAQPLEVRRRATVLCGAAMLAAFAVARYVNVYGDPNPWKPASTAVKTAMSFFNVQKYPPSALFVLVTLGVSILFLGLLDGQELRGRIAAALVTFGRVPLFFYLLQWIYGHVAGVAITAAMGKDVSGCFLNIVQLFSMPQPPDIGGPLRFTYLAWILGVVILYFPCRWFAAVKARRRDSWLSYL